ncbi:MAG: porin PorA family protein [Actinomycetota bacterium]|nr:porin PorA family protein [Actinomycetota bacterium]
MATHVETVGRVRSRRRTLVGSVLVALGAILLVGAPIWRFAVAPELIKFPTDVDQSLTYEGTLRLFVDPATATPLAEPTELTMTVERDVVADSDASGANTVVIDETITIEAEGLAPLEQRFRYVMDRSDAENVADDRAFAYDEANVIDRSGTWRLALPQDVDADETYPIYKNETADAVLAQAAADDPTGELDGLDVINLAATTEPTQVTDAYVASISTLVPLPDTLTVDGLRPVLAQAGLDLDALVAELGPALGEAELGALTAALDAEVAITYLDGVTSTDAVEQRTGAVVDVQTVQEMLVAQPDVTALAGFAELLQPFADVPAVADAMAAVAGLEATTIPVFELDYAQTPASTEDLVAEVKDQLSAIDWWSVRSPSPPPGSGSCSSSPASPCS